MNKDDVYRDIGDHLKQEGAIKVAIFGSYIHDEERSESDIDVLVTFSETKSLLELVRIERELTEAIGIKVDLITDGGLESVHKGYCTQRDDRGIWMTKYDSVYLHHILDSISKIESFTGDMSDEEFKSNELVQSAVIRQIEIIGD